MSKKVKRIPNMQRRPSRKQQAQFEAVAQSSEGESTTYYVHGPRGIHAQEKDGVWGWMVQDGQNSVRSVVDNNVAVHQSIIYDPFGNPIGVVGPEQTMYGYTGEPTDNNELVHLRGRYYHPGLGTFISQDPMPGSMNDPMSLNGYAYVHGNPVNRTDPSGTTPIGQTLATMMYSNPAGFAQMMNTGMCFALLSQINPCGALAGQAQIDCLIRLTPTPTIIPGTPTPGIWHVPCNFAFPLNVRQGPSILSPVVVQINNPAGVQLQTSTFIPGDLQLGGSGWYFVNALAGWVHDGNLDEGPSPCPISPTLVTPTPQPTPTDPTPTPGTGDLDTLSRVINCEAASATNGVAGIAHAIYNRMTSGPEGWPNYRTPLGIVQNTGIDCYTRGTYQTYPRSSASDAAAKWLLGTGQAPNNLSNSMIDLQAYYWLGVPNTVATLPGETEHDALFRYILSRPDLYDYSQCNISENYATRLARLRNRFVALDPPQNTERQLRTVYFSLSPLCP